MTTATTTSETATIEELQNQARSAALSTSRLTTGSGRIIGLLIMVSPYPADQLLRSLRSVINKTIEAGEQNDPAAAKLARFSCQVTVEERTELFQFLKG
ncbi:MAG: hypothetical protein A2511_10735 [Deltaproteobacteria bacterium RIFOXYD12_FULL_50_9]|nr:MAG: hypothetical protein A2511_10735 [Deltaproteobacteria bacterium RIFOXYD12_FULL_50_9]